MTRFRVLVTARAEREIGRVSRWWRENRPESPALFLDELHHAFSRLSKAPDSGSPYRTQRYPRLRRVLLPRTRYHLYYTSDDTTATVTVRVLWHASRGRDPRLR